MASPERCRAFSLVVGLLATTSVVEQSRADDWPSVIRRLERSGSSRSDKEQLAIAYNNHAIELSNGRNWEEAEKALERAMLLDPRNERLRRNLATILLNHAYEESQQRHLHRQARRLAERALQVDPGLWEAHLLIGDIDYANQQLWQAKLAWTKAQKLEPASADIRSRLERLESEYEVEKQFDRAGGAFFDLRYQDEISRSTAFDLGEALRQARRDVGKDFHYWPKHRIVVLIYAPESFARVRRGPDWVAGIYDGKIRVAFPETRAAREAVKATLVHEYTHALIHDLAGGACPIWLNEGIAEYQEAQLRKGSLEELRVAVRINRLIPLAALDNSFSSAEAAQARLAYQQSFSFVSYLVEKYRFYRVRRVIEHLGEGQSLDNAFRKEFYLSLGQLEAKWQRWLPDFVR